MTEFDTSNYKYWTNVIQIEALNCCQMHFHYLSWTSTSDYPNNLNTPRLFTNSYLSFLPTILYINTFLLDFPTLENNWLIPASVRAGLCCIFPTIFQRYMFIGQIPLWTLIGRSPERWIFCEQYMSLVIYQPIGTLKLFSHQWRQYIMLARKDSNHDNISLSQ